MKNMKTTMNKEYPPCYPTQIDTNKLEEISKKIGEALHFVEDVPEFNTNLQEYISDTIDRIDKIIQIAETSTNDSNEYKSSLNDFYNLISVLNHGEIANIYKSDEKRTLLENLINQFEQLAYTFYLKSSEEIKPCVLDPKIEEKIKDDIENHYM